MSDKPNHKYKRKVRYKIMAKEKTWSANETQKNFMGALSKDNYLCLRQVNHKLGLLGTDKEIKSGAVNSLKGKGLVTTKEDGALYNAIIVETRTYADGTVITITKEKENQYETGYKLV